MRLKHIKLSGFKSFVDPTTVSVPGRLVGVVGPNGCGKSNVIDAVRWVMGESSAKNLRGDNMADVIFNGSAARKPVGKAAVELVFDNSEGRAPGAYGQYTEIAIRRELARDGESSYFINKTKCRRRDITDIFLGTGLGARSYSIIEQGMVSRIIEAKPEDLRVLVEEASGISKYKERRRETETRIRHTQENLARVEDIRSELETQLRRLKRQSTAAERYKVLKQEERLLRAQLMSIRWRNLDHELSRKDGELARLQNESDARLADQRAAEKRIESLRKDQTEANERLNQVQADFYRTGAEISAVEQSIDHLRETRDQQRQELDRLIATRGSAQQHLIDDRERMAQLEEQLRELSPQLQAAESALVEAARTHREAEQAFNAWQADWEAFGEEAARPEQEREVQRTRIEEHEQQIGRLVERQTRLESALGELDTQAVESEIGALRGRSREIETRFEDLQRRIESLDLNIEHKRGWIEQSSRELNERRDRHHDIDAKLLSLKELQAAALGEHDEALQEWLRDRGLDHASRLNSRLRVAPGWELAVDRVLGGRAGAVCVDDLQAAVGAAGDLTEVDLFLVEPGPSAKPASQDLPRLLERIEECEVDLRPWLEGVFTAEDLTQAMQLRSRLDTSQSIVTRSGVWLGRNWAALAGGHGAGAGVLARESEIEALDQRLQASQSELTALADALDQARYQVANFERERADGRRELNEVAEQRSIVRQDLARREARLAELQSRRQQTQHDLDELQGHLRQARDSVMQAQGLLSEAEQAAVDFAARRERLLAQRDTLRTALSSAGEAAADNRERRHRLEYEQQGVQTELNALRESVSRNTAQSEAMLQRQQELESLLDDQGRPEQELKAQLETLLQQRLQVEQSLNAARVRMEELDLALRNEEQQRAGCEQAVDGVRDQLEGLRIARQEQVVRRDAVAEQIAESDHDPVTLLKDIAEDAREEQWQEELESVSRKINRIGPVNLVAIEEYEEQSERKDYLDQQHADLSEALATLGSVIQKIDRETRARFKDTFENLNNRFQDFFPRLFGGGSAYLELTGNDLLDTGVSVMARPPGKRNSTIHLLSGGEKALTAVALMFSFFDLNPAPFCMLDEVDAPLDDANVERYSEVLKTLAERTQLIFITHNKITMERADILIGVTMGEPGVSRLVAVDVEEAMEMAVQ